MSSPQAEVLSWYATRYAEATKKDKGRILNDLTAYTGWSRGYARRRLTAQTATHPGQGRRASSSRQRRSTKFSGEAISVLRRVWVVSGNQCGKYLVVSLPLLLDLLEAHRKLVFGQAGYSRDVRTELVSMSAASIDRHLRPFKSHGSDPA